MGDSFLLEWFARHGVRQGLSSASALPFARVRALGNATRRTSSWFAASERSSILTSWGPNPVSILPWL